MEKNIKETDIHEYFVKFGTVKKVKIAERKKALLLLHYLRKQMKQ